MHRSNRNPEIQFYNKNWNPHEGQYRILFVKDYTPNLDDKVIDAYKVELDISTTGKLSGSNVLIEDVVFVVRPISITGLVFVDSDGLIGFYPHRASYEASSKIEIEVNLWTN